VDIEQLVARTAVAGMYHMERFYELEGARDWNVDMTAGQLTFAGGGTYDTELLGTTSDADDSFVWAWANPSAAPGHFGLASAVRAFGAEHAVHPLDLDRFIAPAPLPFALTCVGLALSGASAGFTPKTDGGNACFLVVMPAPFAPPDAIALTTTISAVIAAFAVPHRLVVEGAGEAWEWPVEGTEERLVLHHPEGPLHVTFDSSGRIQEMSSSSG
jgi:hypothetical protein